MMEKIKELETRLTKLEKHEMNGYTQLSRLVITLHTRVDGVELRVNTLLDQAEDLLGLKAGQGGIETLDARTVNLKTLVDAVNALRADMRDLKQIVSEL